MEQLTRHVLQHAPPGDADETNGSASDHLKFSFRECQAGVLGADRKDLSQLHLDTRCRRASCGSTSESTTKVGGHAYSYFINS